MSFLIMPGKRHKTPEIINDPRCFFVSSGPELLKKHDPEQDPRNDCRNKVRYSL